MWYARHRCAAEVTERTRGKGEDEVNEVIIPREVMRKRKRGSRPYMEVAHHSMSCGTVEVIAEQQMTGEWKVYAFEPRS